MADTLTRRGRRDAQGLGSAGAGETGSWVHRRDEVVCKAVDDGDRVLLAHASALPGGYGSSAQRKTVWLHLLRVKHLFPPREGGGDVDDDDGDGDGPSLEPHMDEAQVLLDTKRSFVLYPRDLPPGSKQLMQDDLQYLIVHVLRRHRRLRYFQGFHDIMSVLYLTLVPIPTSPRESPREERSTPEWTALLQLAEAVSLCLVRDAMGHGMEPMMGYLKILQRLLGAADPVLAKVSASLSPVPTLPFFALSWVLCLFSHDVDTLEPVQRLFDFLLARNPISAIYLAVAILVAKKDQMLQLAKEQGPEARDDPSLLHPLFSRLPPLYPDTPDEPLPRPGWSDRGQRDDDPNPYRPIPISRVLSIAEGLMARYAWDGPVIRGREILGKGSVVATYDQLADDGWTLDMAEKMVDDDVILPGASEPDEVTVVHGGLRLGKGHIVALGVVAIGLGIAVYSWRWRSDWRTWPGWHGGWRGSWRWWWVPGECPWPVSRVGRR